MLIIPKEIQEMMLADAVKYNIRLSFPNKERTDITCNQIVEGSAKFTESLCSQDSLKFGLCESPTFECETVGVGNITGCKIELTYEVICDANTSGAEFRTDLQKFVFPIKKGVFVVSSSERQADMQHRKIVAYGGGASFDWKLPEYEKVSRVREDIPYYCDIFRSMLTNFDLKDFSRIDSQIVAEEREEMSATITHNTSAFRYINITSKYLMLKIPSNDNNIYYANYECLQDVDSLYRNLINKLVARFDSFEINDEIKQALLKMCDFMKKGNVARAFDEFFVKNNEDYYLLQGALFVNKEQYINKYSPNKDDAYYLFIPYSIKARCYNSALSDIFVAEEMLLNQSDLQMMKISNNMPSYIVNESITEISKRNLNEIFASSIEILGKIGRINNDGSVEFINLNKQFYLKPNKDLKPNENLKPLGVNGSSIGKNQYSSLWYEELYTKPYGRVYCEYTNKSGTQSVRNVYLNGFNSNSEPNEYLMYSLTSNEIIQNNQYSQEEMTEILEVIAESIKDVSYVPLKLQCVSVPFVECGDTLEVLTQNNDSITTIVMKRTLSGESYVTDEITSV